MSLSSNISRRHLLHLLGATPFAAPLFTFGCGPSNTSKTLRLYGTATLDIGPDNWKKLTDQTGISIEFTDNGNDVGPVLAEMLSGTAAQAYDLGGIQGGAEPEMYQAGVILPWDVSKIPMWNTVWDWMKTIPNLNQGGKQIGLPVVANADSVIYLENETGLVDSYSAVFDPKYRGRASMEDAWMNSVIFAAIYMKGNNIEGLGKIKTPGDLEEDELRTVMGFLTKHKKDGQFYKFWNGWQEGLELITKRKVVVMTGWEPIVYAAQLKGVTDVRYAVPREGYEGWSNNLVLHRGAHDRDMVEVAHQFANWQLSGYYGCVLGSLRGYMVPTDGCVDLSEKSQVSYRDTQNGTWTTVHADDARTLRNHVRKKFLEQKGQVYWQNARPKNYELYEQLWAELRAA